MARLGSIAIGGFYPTPAHILPLIASKLFTRALNSNANIGLVDPCAGEGAALAYLACQFVGPTRRTYIAELEPTRASLAKKALYAFNCKALQGDAFRVHFEKDENKGASLLYLNPPYDLDKVHGRLEEKFLSRFAGVLAPGGVLVFVVPFYALEASKVTLAKEFQGLECYRFPGEDFATFKQVVLFAEKRMVSGFTPDPAILAQVEAWASAPTMPELTSRGGARYTLPTFDYGCGLTWSLRPLDISTLSGKVQGWTQVDRSGKSYAMDGLSPHAQEMGLERKYPVAVPPKAAHIATGIAAGVFNGCKVTATEGKGLPALLVKGSFDREWMKVEEKQNKDGEVTGVVEVQQPQLKVTVLDLSRNEFVTLKTGDTGTWADSLDGMTTGDLLREYGSGLMDALLHQCPVLHDPSREGDNFPLPTMERELYPAQASAARALVKLLGGPSVGMKQRKGKAAYLLGEIGSGKSITALTVAKAIGAKRPLILCPPHLLDSWKEQVKLSCPEVSFTVLTSVEDVQAWAKDNTPGIAVLSREAAKLSHGYVGIEGSCPGCGAFITTSPEDNAKKRLSCSALTIRPGKDSLAHLAYGLAVKLAFTLPGNSSVKQILGGRFFQKYLAGKAKTETPWTSPDLTETFLALAEEPKDQVNAFILAASFVADKDALARGLFWAYLESYTRNSETYSSEANVRGALKWLIALSPNGDKAIAILKELCPEAGRGYHTTSDWVRWETEYDTIMSGESSWGCAWSKDEEGNWAYNKVTLGSKEAATTLLDTLAVSAKWVKKEGCGTHLYQAEASPRRYPLGTLITRKYAHAFDFLIFDESHEGNSENSAQAKSAHRLMGVGHPVLCLTGSVMNGYARSLFSNLWQVSSSLRAEFERNEAQSFVDRYGYRKRLVQDKDKETGEIVAYGSNSDRTERKEKMIGETPGVLPLLVLKHLLACSVTLHKADLQVHLPPCSEERILIQPSSEQSRNLSELQQSLLNQIKEDMFDPEKAGKLWGQLAELPSYLDRATQDVGKVPGWATYPICYPESMGHELVVEVPAIGKEELLPKEKWLLETVAKEIEAGRNVMVFAWHTNLMPRIKRLLEGKIGEEVPILDPAKVTTAKRQAWIEKEITKKNRPVLIVNPVAVQTGLNSLTHFSTVIWYENPACNPVVYRQANGRIDRIGQKKNTRVLFPVYDCTITKALHQLLLHKVAVSLATDGLDNESTLSAAGMGTSDNLTGLSVGKQLFELITNKVRLRGQNEKF